MELQISQNNLSFSLYITLFTYYLVTTSEVEVEFNRKSTDENKYVNLILEISVNSNRKYD